KPARAVVADWHPTPSLVLWDLDAVLWCGDACTDDLEVARYGLLRSEPRRLGRLDYGVLFVYVAVQASGNPPKRPSLERHVVPLGKYRVVSVGPESRRIRDLALLDSPFDGLELVPYSDFRAARTSIAV